jgi:hypothetical protein
VTAAVIADRADDGFRAPAGHLPPDPPVQQAHAAFRRFIADHRLDVLPAARFLAMTTVTIGDAFIACFEAKYHYAFWRPVTAIRAGDTDGNPATGATPPSRISRPRWGTPACGAASTTGRPSRTGRPSGSGWPEPFWRNGSVPRT